jgi:psiF repeat
MKFAATTLALVLALGASSAFAAAETAPAKTLTPQQQKMKDCNTQAGDKKGDERKTFMSTCLKSGDTTAATDAPAAAAAPAVAAAPVAGSPPAPKRNPQAQREKMKTCNAQAGQKHLTGAERKSFMSTCLKGNGAAAPAH